MDQERLAHVIGGANGIGAACSRLMSKRGWRVVFGDKDGEAAQRMAVRRRGSIVNIASLAGIGSTPWHIYGPSKAAIVNLTQCLAGQWGRAGVRVNSVSPGVTLVPRVIARQKAGVRYATGDPGARTALGRLVEPSEVAEGIEFLASDRASAITGINLIIDAGWLVASTWEMYGGIRPLTNP